MEDIFITKVEIKKVRHLENLEISLSKTERKHLILTGRNGSGKTSVLEKLRDYLAGVENTHILSIPQWEKELKGLVEEITAIEKKIKQPFLPSEQGMCMQDQYNLQIEQLKKDKFNHEQQKDSIQDVLNKYSAVKIFIHPSDIELVQQYKSMNFVLSYFEAKRKGSNVFQDSKSIEEPTLPLNASWDRKLAVEHFLKYIVYLKSQSAFALEEGDQESTEQIDRWFVKFEDALKEVFEDPKLKIKFDRKELRFQIITKDKEPFDLKTLSDGYSAILEIVTELIMRMEACGESAYDMQGIVLVDEIETHLHLELQKKILPFLTSFFPKIQFIVTTHSPFVLNSISNAVIYDLENKMHIEDASDLSYSGLVEGYFKINSEYSSLMENKMSRYEELKLNKNLSDSDLSELVELEIEFKNLSPLFSPEMFNRYSEAKRK